MVEVWGEDYAEIVADPAEMRKWADRCGVAALNLEDLAGQFYENAAIPPEAWTGWVDLISLAGTGGVFEKLFFSLMEVQYNQVHNATKDRLYAIAGTAHDLASGIRQTAAALEEQDCSNSSSIDGVAEDAVSEPTGTGQTGL